MLAEFVWDDGGQSGMEYLLLLALAALGVIAAAYGIGDDIKAILDQIRLALGPVQNTITPIYRTPPSNLGSS